ncbi:MAG: winged helix-turn-helix domain-containing protein [Thaumarchaeota archaeon]|nr:winged helix-turn-helix domain-containing protein [Nitrososphaerota archaeon]
MQPSFAGVVQSPLAFLKRWSPRPPRVSMRGASTGRVGSDSPPVDPAFKRLLMYLLVGTKGGFNRLQIMKLIQDEPLNPNKIGEKLNLDYKTVQHHLKILRENSIVVTSSPSGTYGAMYFLAPFVEKNISLVDEIWARFGKR